MVMKSNTLANSSKQVTKNTRFFADCAQQACVCETAICFAITNIVLVRYHQ